MFFFSEIPPPNEKFLAHFHARPPFTPAHSTPQLYFLPSVRLGRGGRSKPGGCAGAGGTSVKIGELFSCFEDPRLSDWQYAALAEDQIEPDGSGNDWALSEMADGRTDAECAENVTSE